MKVILLKDVKSLGKKGEIVAGLHELSGKAIYFPR